MTYNVYGKELSRDEVVNFVSYHHEKFKADRNSRFHALIGFIDKKDQKILDYGCGWGGMCAELSKKGHSVTGIDLIDNEIEICKAVWEEQENLKFYKKSIEEISSEQFDVVVSSQVIEHVHNVGNYLSEISRVLVKGGELIISLPNVLTPYFFIHSLRKNFKNHLIRYNKNILSQGYDKRDFHINAWDPIHFNNLLSTFGFELIDYRPTEGLPVLNKYFFLPFFKNNRYTMCFRYKKVEDISIKNTD